MTRISALYPSFVGFENLFTELEKFIDGPTTISTFPPHNIIKVNDNNFIIEMAIAGFTKEEIDVEVEDGGITIRGEKKNKENLEYLYRGIATRSFTKKIRLMETIEVREAEFKDGILRIGLENVIPDHKKPRKIEIGSELKMLQKKLLQEEVTV